MNDRSNAKIVIIGAGLGGLSAAISIAAEGYNVLILEKNEKIGGKLNLLQQNGFTFDLGPSIFTLPHIFEKLFNRANRSFYDFVSLIIMGKPPALPGDSQSSTVPGLV